MGLKSKIGTSGAQIGFKKNGSSVEVSSSGKASIGFKTGGVGAKISLSSNGVTVSGGIGIIDVDFNVRNGTGRVAWGFGLYEMRVSRENCTYIKEFYIAGVYTHTEYQPITDGDCKREKKEDDKRKKNIGEEEDIPEFENFPRSILDPNAYPSNKKMLALFQSIAYEQVFGWVYRGYSLDGVVVEPDIKVQVSTGLKVKTPKISRMWGRGIWPDILVPIYENGVFRYIKMPDWEMQIDFSVNISDYGDIEDRCYSVLGGSSQTKIIDRGDRPHNMGIGGSYLPFYFFGSYSAIVAFVNGYQLNPDGGEFYSYITPCIRIKRRIVGVNLFDDSGSVDRPVLKLPPPPPKMNKECCDKLDKRLQRLEAVLATQLLLDNNGVKVPKNLFIPGGRGDIEIGNYADYLATIIRVQAQSGIFPFSIEKKDTNLVAQGNQSQTYYLPTATEAMKAVLENSIDNETKNDAILNLSVRIGIMVSKIVGKITFIEKTLQAISDFLGYPRREKIVRERIEVDPTLGARKQVGFRGFGPAPRNTNRKIEKQIELIRKKLEEGDKSLESALADFLQPDDVAVRYEEFDDESGAPDLMELIDKGR